MKRRSYSYDLDTESEKDEDKGVDNKGDDDKGVDNKSDDDKGVDNEHDDNAPDKGGYNINQNDYEPRVTLGGMISDLDDSEAGTVFLNVLEAYMVLILAFYLFFVIS